MCHECKKMKTIPTSRKSHLETRGGWWCTVCGVRTAASISLGCDINGLETDRGMSYRPLLESKKKPVVHHLSPLTEPNSLPYVSLLVQKCRDSLSRLFLVTYVGKDAIKRPVHSSRWMINPQLTGYFSPSMKIRVS